MWKKFINWWYNTPYMKIYGEYKYKQDFKKAINEQETYNTLTSVYGLVVDRENCIFFSNVNVPKRLAKGDADVEAIIKYASNETTALNEYLVLRGMNTFLEVNATAFQDENGKILPNAGFIYALDFKHYNPKYILKVTILTLLTLGVIGALIFFL